MKTLYFEGAGWSKAESSMETIGNCRVRTAFHLDNGKPVYLEMMCGSPLKSKNGNVYLTGISHLYYITDDEHNDDCNLHPHPYFIKYIRREVPDFEYSSEAILKFVNSLGCSFDEIKVVPDLGGYRVFKENMYSYKKGTEQYNYGDEFVFEPELHDRRMQVWQHIYDLEKSEGKRYPNFSLWVDPDDRMKLHLLRHFPNLNRHWIISIDEWEGTGKAYSEAQEVQLGKFGC